MFHFFHNDNRFGFSTPFGVLFLFLFFSATPTEASSISLTMKNEPLWQVLQNVGAKSGIRFVISDTVGRKKITRHIEAKNWSTVVRILLDDFNLVEVKGNSGLLTQVFVLGISTERGNATLPDTSDHWQRPMNKNEITLTSSQLMELAQGPFRGPLPKHFIDNPNYRNLLTHFGIHSSKDLVDPAKAMRVRVESRRQLHLQSQN